MSVACTVAGSNLRLGGGGGGGNAERGGGARVMTATGVPVVVVVFRSRSVAILGGRLSWWCNDLRLRLAAYTAERY
jgi:hypothetical protein